jgi:hypothetical protein
VPGVHKTEASENASLQLLRTYLLSEYSTETAHVVDTNASITRTHQVLKRYAWCVFSAHVMADIAASWTKFRPMAIARHLESAGRWFNTSGCRYERPFSLRGNDPWLRDTLMGTSSSLYFPSI